MDFEAMQGFFETDSGQSDNDELAGKGKKNKGPKRYVPQKNSVSYALLITLFRDMENGSEFMRKQDLIDAAEASGLSRVPIMPEKAKGKAGHFGSSPKDWYSGWSCMKTLINRGLVVKSSCPAKYMLTDEGKDIARDCLSRSGMIDQSKSLDGSDSNSNQRDNFYISDRVDKMVVDIEGDIPDLDGIRAPERKSSQPSISSNKQKKSIDDSEGDLPDLDAIRALKRKSSQPSISSNKQKKSIDVPPEYIDKFVSMGFSEQQIIRAFTEVTETSQTKEISSVWPTVLCHLREDEIYGSTSVPKVPNYAQQAAKSSNQIIDEFYASKNIQPRATAASSSSQRSSSKKIIDTICSQIKIEVRWLPVGDAIWVARHKYVGSKYVLDFIVERKKVDDLRTSIRDNRYRDQKMRLVRRGLKKMIYLVEGDPDSSEAAESIKTACFTTEILEGFDVQRTSKLADTFRKYGYLTQSINQYYISLDPDKNCAGVCPPFDEFIRRCEELDKMTVSDVFTIQLMQVPQVTEEIALAVLDLYPTLLSLARSYSLLDGDICAQEEMLKKQSNSLINGPASKNIFQLVWGS